MRRSSACSGVLAAFESNFRYCGSAKTNTVGLPGFLSTQNEEGEPEATAMYCRPAIEYVTTPAPIGRPC